MSDEDKERAEERSEKASAIERVTKHFDLDPNRPMERDSRIPKMWALMTVEQLGQLATRLDKLPQLEKLEAVVEGIIDSADAQGDEGRRKYDELSRQA